jgi:hypothetical protein
LLLFASEAFCLKAKRAVRAFPSEDIVILGFTGPRPSGTSPCESDRYGNRNFVEANTTMLPKNCGTSPNFVVCTADKKAINPSISPNTNRLIQDQDNDSVNDYLFDTSGNNHRPNEI